MQPYADLQYSDKILVSMLFKIYHDTALATISKGPVIVSNIVALMSNCYRRTILNMSVVVARLSLYRLADIERSMYLEALLLGWGCEPPESVNWDAWR